MRRVASIAELYVHAIAIEREAAERYAELAERMRDESNEDLAALFAGLAALETEHLQALERRTAGVELPPLARSDYKWLGQDAPESAARELVFRLMTPQHALRIALGAEKRAQAFFEHVLVSADDPALRGLAREMAADEQEHVLLLERMLESTPDPLVHWEDLYEA
ncbi:MAG TPA: ferritin family protein [Burkholderiales bacterium]|nr:ferritin family protein [Burkholderiales bacterium]